MKLPKRFALLMLATALTGPTLSGCARANDASQQTQPRPSGQQSKTSAKTKTPAKTMKIRLKIENTTFTATLDDNATARAFQALLPLTTQMVELHGNEKYALLSVDLPTNASNPRTIQTGDLMLYGGNTLVIFYQTFPTSYNYTRLGRISDTAGLAAALGSGNVKVTYELP